MADFFHVELSTLGRYVTTLRDAHQQLGDLPKLMRCDGMRLGNGKLNEAAGDFQGCWEYGAKQLTDLVSETTEAVNVVVQAYSKTDETVSGAISMLRAGGGVTAP